MTTPRHERKSFAFEVKDLSDAGTFTGIASVYGNVDLQHDSVDRGAFKKTLAERGSEVPLLWQHDQSTPIGLGTLSDSPDGLQIKGQFCLDTVKGAEAYALMKARVIKGLSIGYDVVKQGYEAGVRHLKELKLYEVSCVTFPANEEATVSRVKSIDLATFDVKALGLPDAIACQVERLVKAASLSDRISGTYAAVRASFPMSSAWPLSDETYDDFVIVCNGNDYYSIAITAWDADGVPTLGDAVEVERTYVPIADGDDKTVTANESKAGRAISAQRIEKLKAAADHMTKAIDHVNGVIDSASPKDKPKAKRLGTSTKEAATDSGTPSGAADDANEPSLEDSLGAFNDRMRKLLD